MITKKYLQIQFNFYTSVALCCKFMLCRFKNCTANKSKGVRFCASTSAKHRFASRFVSRFAIALVLDALALALALARRAWAWAWAWAKPTHLYL